MFEKYNLIHLETREQLTKATVGRLASLWGSARAESALPEFPEALEAESEFALLGSFEVLPPVVFPIHLRETLLHCQSFSVMEAGSGYYTRRRNYASCLVCYTYGGEGTLRYGGQTYTLREGDGFIIDCREEQEYFTSGSTWKHLDLHIGGPFEPIYQQFAENGAVAWRIPSASRFNRMCEAFLDAYTVPSPSRNVYVHRALTDLLCDLLASAEEESGKAVPSGFAELIGWMEQHYTEPLSLDDAADVVHLSKYHFSREFKRCFGLSPHQYLIALRIQHACLLLESTRLPVADVGTYVGIPNQANFTKLFRKQTGLTPGRYRRERSGARG